MDRTQVINCIKQIGLTAEARSEAGDDADTHPFQSIIDLLEEDDEVRVSDVVTRMIRLLDAMKERQMLTPDSLHHAQTLREMMEQYYEDL